ncbi:MarR family winged helix-turn-helix transcriptional regulator [Paenibacillus sp. 481]|uniref:MarR family winged helix-turn-helix transcriptional regulator n=1 Tax=Paenibacillus sp. 481 TaxID=2835869 RepID=UPI001E36E792|nr:MarR family transcriptional regulator [Paenibacillus sp. 481]UHA73529.1 MarR family transcriptional regulator [Paenibacillus sp. 481]
MDEKMDTKQDAKWCEAIQLFEEVMIYGTNHIMNELKLDIFKELSVEQVRLLDLLNTQGPLTSTEITELQGGHKSATSNRIKKLIQKDYVRFEQKEGDHRIKHVVITDKGYAATKVANESSFKYFQSLLSDVTEEEIEQLMVTFKKVKAILLAK